MGALMGALVGLLGLRDWGLGSTHRAYIGVVLYLG